MNRATYACFKLQARAFTRRMRRQFDGECTSSRRDRLTGLDIYFTIRDDAWISAMTDLIRSACLTHYAELARAAGIDPRKMLRKARLPLACLDHQDMRIAISGVRRLLEASAAAADIDEFGLRMAERGGLSNLGPVALIVREQATVGAAIEALARYIHIHHEAMRLRVEQHDD